MKKTIYYSISIIFVSIIFVSCIQKKYINTNMINKLFCENQSAIKDSLLKDFSDVFIRGVDAYVFCYKDYVLIIKDTSDVILIKEVFPSADNKFYKINDTSLKNRIYYVEIERFNQLFNLCIDNGIFSIHCRENNRIIFKMEKFEVIYDKVEKPPLKYEYKELCKDWYYIEIK